VGIYNSGIGSTVFSSALTRDGTMDMAVFEIDAAAGDTFKAHMWQLSGTQSAAAYSLAAFDVASYNFNVANGANQTNTAVLNGAPAKLLKTGDGVLIVTNANTYGGGTTVSAGTLELGNGGSVIGSITNNAVLSINRNDTNTLANAISGSGSLSKAGAGTVILTNANTYGGTTAVSAGRLAVAHGDALGSTSGGTTVESGAQLMLSNVVVGNEAVTINGDGLASGAQFAGSLRSIGTNTLGGKVTLGSDAKIFGGTGTSLTLDVVSGDGVNLASHNLTIDGAGASRIQDAIVGTGRLTKEGSGTLTLEGANTYTGGTTISAGTLKLQGGSVAGNITNNANLTITGGTELVNIISGNGSLTKADSGLSILWSSNSYTGATVVEAGSLRLDGSGSLSASTTLQVASGTLFSATGVFKTSNNLTLAGLTGAGEVFNKAGILTVNKSSGTDTFEGLISGDQELIKSGDGTLILAGASSYTGASSIVGGRLVLGHSNALGGTSTGTVVVSGAQLRLNPLADTEFAAEPLSLSGEGLTGTVGGALRNATNNNTWKGKITLAANASIGAHSGTTLTLDVDSGDAIDLAGFDLVFDGAGMVQINDPIAGAGQISKIGSGQLVVNNSVLTATIQSNAVSVHFANPPGDGTFAVLSGPLDAASLASVNVTGLDSGQTATVANSPNLVIQVADAPAGPTFDSAYPANSLTDLAPNGLTYLMNYAFGGSSTHAATLPSQDFNDPTKLTLVAFVRTDNTGGVLSVVGEAGDALSNFDSANPIPGEVALDQSDAPAGTEKRIFSVPANGDRLFLRLKATLTP
jgi:autotransporter-associated beta strand protein